MGYRGYKGAGGTRSKRGMGLQEAELLWEGGCGAEGVYVAYMALSPWGTIWGHAAPGRTHAGLAGWVLVAMCPPPPALIAKARR